ncbi:MAG: hypothetical protein JWN27_1674 [Candidatus Eremiobacteraeota bacterium]|nr:hypothetical protein [Candidatus Eremiobacteraeota bacterium]
MYEPQKNATPRSGALLARGGGFAAPSMPYLTYVRPDGFSLLPVQINEFGHTKPKLGTWTTPDANDGDVRDPASQQRSMWNRGNAVDYEDPSEYSAAAIAGAPLAVSAALEFLGYLLIAGGAVAWGHELQAHGGAIRRGTMDVIGKSAGIDAQNPGIGLPANFEEHRTGARPSSEEQHQYGQARQNTIKAVADVIRPGVRRRNARNQGTLAGAAGKAKALF